jgi:hypothetical protein
MVSTDWE